MDVPIVGFMSGSVTHDYDGNTLLWLFKWIMSF